MNLTVYDKLRLAVDEVGSGMYEWHLGLVPLLGECGTLLIVRPEEKESLLWLYPNAELHSHRAPVDVYRVDLPVNDIQYRYQAEASNFAAR